MRVLHNHDVLATLMRCSDNRYLPLERIQGFPIQARDSRLG